MIRFMKKNVQNSIQTYEMIETGDTIVVAASGGVDSMVLLHLLSVLTSTQDVRIVVAHVNHQMRPSAPLDAQLVKKIASLNGFAYEEAALPPVKDGQNFHDYARAFRYRFFKEVAKKYHAAAVATGHHADDHLETVLERLLRGSILPKWVGIKPVAQINGVRVIRPLIEATKADLVAYAKQEKLVWREDASNQALTYRRNRIRHLVVPELKKEAANVALHARRFGAQLALDEAYFTEQVDALLEANVRQESSTYTLSLSWLQRLHPSLRQRLLVRLMPHIRRRALVDVLAFVDAHHASAQLDVGAKTRLKKHLDVFCVEVGHDEKPLDYDFVLSFGEPVTLPTGEQVSVWQGKSEKVKKNEAQKSYLCYNEIRLPLRVRNRRSGDRIQLKGQAGRAKVSRIMKDAKLSQKQRAHWPLIVDDDDVVVWIPGLKKAPCHQDAPTSDADILIVFE